MKKLMLRIIVPSLFLFFVAAGCRRSESPAVKPVDPPTAATADAASPGESTPAAVGGIDSAPESAIAPVDETPPAETPAAPAAMNPRYATPKQTVKTMFDTLIGTDRQAFMGCFSAGDDVRPLIPVMFDTVTSMLRMKTAIEAEYGPEGWTVFQNVGGQGLGAGLANSSGDMIEKMDFQERGNKAVGRMPGSGPMNFVRVGDRWLIDVPMAELPPEHVAQAAKMMTLMVQVTDGITAQVGKPDQTPETLRAAFMSNFMTAVSAAAEQSKVDTAKAAPPQ